MKSDITAETNLIGQDIVGKFIGEVINEGYVFHYFKSIDYAIKKGSAICSYEIHGRVFMAKLKRISDRRVKAIEYDVTNMSLCDVVTLF